MQDETNLPVSPDMESLLDLMAEHIRRRWGSAQENKLRLVGILTGGAWVAEQLRARLKITEPIGLLNISFYRDDFSRRSLHPEIQPSSLPFDIENQEILLIDDVLMTGRTIRAAMNELFDYGRPSAIRLAVLADVGARELPMRPDVVGWTLKAPEGYRLKLNSKDGLLVWRRIGRPQM